MSAQPTNEPKTSAHKSSAIGTMIFLALFAVGVPILNSMGIVSDQTVNLWGRYCCFAIAALGVDLIWGYTGILSLCQAFFFCLGGYAIGMHMLLKTGNESVYGAAIPDFMVWNQVTELPWFWEGFHTLPGALALALLVPGLFALIFGYFTFRSRIKGVYFAVITQALAYAVYLIFLRNETMLGGTNGLTDFKSLAGFDLTLASSKTGLYVFSVVSLMAMYWLCRFIVHSKCGKILTAIRDSEHRVRFTGYSIWHYKLFVFVVAAMIAAFGGLLYVPQTGIITPGRMSVQASIYMVIWVAVGGRGNLVGAIVGAIAVGMFYSWITSVWADGWLFCLGLLFIGVVLVFPQGLVGLINNLFKGKSKPDASAKEAV